MMVVYHVLSAESQHYNVTDSNPTCGFFFLLCSIYSKCLLTIKVMTSHKCSKQRFGKFEISKFSVNKFVLANEDCEEPFDSSGM